MPDEEFFEMLPDTIRWEKRTGIDVYSRPTYAAPDSIEHCRVNFQLREQVSSEGSETVRAGTITIGTLTTMSGQPIAIGIDDRITLPNGSQPRIADVRFVNDETGPHHIVIEVGRSGGAGRVHAG